MRHWLLLLPLFCAAPAMAQQHAQGIKPGSCFELVFVPPQFETKTERVLKQPAGERIEKVPARYEWVEEKVLVPAGEVTIATKAAEYEITEEKVEVAPAREAMVTVPARYKTVREKVATKTGPVLKRGRVSSDQKGDDGILCVVEQATEFKWVEKKVLVTPARQERVQLPVRYKTIKHRKLITPAKTKKIMARERYRTKRVRKLVEPEGERRVPVPAVYEVITRQVMTSAGHSEWCAVLCETNATPELITALQTALKDAGHYRGPLNGRYDSRTDVAVQAYQSANNMPQYGVTLETLDKLGVSR